VATVEAIEAIRPIILGPQSKSRDNSISRLFSRVLQARNTTISKRKERGGDKVNPWNERGVDRLLVQRGSNPGGDQPIFTRWRDLTNLLRIGDHGGGAVTVATKVFTHTLDMMEVTVVTVGATATVTLVAMVALRAPEVPVV